MPPTHTEQVQQLFVRHTGLLHGFIASLCGDLVLAEDILQEVFLVVSQRADDFTLGSDFAAWARAIARFKTMELLRTRKRDRQMLSVETLAALEAAAARGVAVTLILPGQTDFWVVFHVGRSYYERLLRAGVRIFERQGVILHAKTVLIDGVWATVGSTNLDWRSFLHNHELNAVVLGAEFGQQVQLMFEQDLAASSAVTLQTWQRRGAAPRVKEWLARWWEYWL